MNRDTSLSFATSEFMQKPTDAAAERKLREDFGLSDVDIEKLRTRAGVVRLPPAARANRAAGEFQDLEDKNKPVVDRNILKARLLEQKRRSG